MVLESRPDNTEQSYKCSECGLMFSKNKEDSLECPFCYHLCQKGECEVVGSSNEGY